MWEALLCLLHNAAQNTDVKFAALLTAMRPCTFMTHSFRPKMCWMRKRNTVF